jgi:endonuclease/exonuclease/phosphatase family metal-dependent hydrolase
MAGTNAPWSRLATTLALTAALLSSGCARALNYGEAWGPRFAKERAAAPGDGPFDGALDVVTFNLAFARQVERAQKLFDGLEELRRADVVLLQEMDANGTEALAAHLRMAYVYYPAAVHPRTHRDFGNAVLSRWPIIADRKLRLPHRGFFDGSQRTATCATLLTPVEPVEVCSVHIATPLEQLPRARREQLRAVASALGEVPCAVIGGDLNGHGLGRVLTEAAFDWPTKDVGATRGLFSLDHIFTRGLRAQEAGKLGATLEASDHAAVWTRLFWR